MSAGDVTAVDPAAGDVDGVTAEVIRVVVVAACRHYVLARAADQGASVTVTSADLAQRFDLTQGTASDLLAALALASNRVKPRPGADGYLVRYR